MKHYILDFHYYPSGKHDVERKVQRPEGDYEVLQSCIDPSHRRSEIKLALVSEETLKQANGFKTRNGTVNVKEIRGLTFVSYHANTMPQAMVSPIGLIPVMENELPRLNSMAVLDTPQMIAETLENMTKVMGNQIHETTYSERPSTLRAGKAMKPELAPV